MSSFGEITQNYRNPISELGSQGTSGVFGQFRNNKLVQGSSEFLNSNSLVAKVAFLLLVIIIFVFALNLGSKLLAWILQPSPSPVLLRGMHDGRKKKVISVDPKERDSIPILRSKDEEDGVEFTYSTWLFFDDIKNHGGMGDHKHIFNKGSGRIAGNGEQSFAHPLNCPGLYLKANKSNDEGVTINNTLVVLVDSFKHIREEVEVPNIPINKWICVVLRVKHRFVDVYINGAIAKRHELRSVPKQNYGNVYVGLNGGFAGKISELKYWNRALTGVEIVSVNNYGPNLNASDDMHIFPPYLSLRWYFGND